MPDNEVYDLQASIYIYVRVAVRFTKQKIIILFVQLYIIS